MKKMIKMLIAGLMLVGIGSAFAQTGPQGGVSWGPHSYFISDDGAAQGDLVWFSTTDDLS